MKPSGARAPDADNPAPVSSLDTGTAAAGTSDYPGDRARSAAASLCALARVLLRHGDDLDVVRRRLMLTQLEAAADRLGRALS